MNPQEAANIADKAGLPPFRTAAIKIALANLDLFREMSKRLGIPMEKITAEIVVEDFVRQYREENAWRK